MTARPVPAAVSDPAPRRIAIVIPLFKHSGLIWEALATALDQGGETRYGIVLVNDGCPYPSSHQAGLAAAAAAAGTPLVYVRQVNQGLSGARNTGIETALASWPELEALYFLDADNRLSPRSVRNMLDALDRYPEADWFYPDIRMMGLHNMCSMQGRYNIALHAELNLCEAGSLIRRRVFEAGVRYDEKMKKGYEDWEFWFSAIDAGFTTGQHLPSIDYRYRLRPESMVRDSLRADQEIRAYMVAKHPWLDAPPDPTRPGPQDPEARFAVVTPDGACYLNEARADVACVPLDRLTEDFHRWRAKPGAYGFPGKLVFATQQTLDLLAAEGLLPWAIWDLEQRLTGKTGITSLQLETQADGWLTFGDAALLTPETELPPLAMTMVTAELMAEISRETGSLALREGDSTSELPLQHSVRALQLGRPTAPRGAEDSLLMAMSLGWKLCDPDYNSDEALLWAAVHNGALNRKGRVRSFDDERAGTPQIAHPRPPAGTAGPNVAFVVPLADFGGVERVAYQVALDLKARGYQTHLVCIGRGELRIPQEFRAAFGSISWYNSDLLPGPRRGPYLGTFLISDPDPQEVRQLAGLFEGMDVAINCHSSHFHTIAGSLKRRGLLCLDHQHVLEFTPAGQPVGHPIQGLAFEHAYATTLTCSQQLADWLHRQGLPREKLLPLRNGPGILTCEADLDRAERRLRARDPGQEAARPLRLLFLGRLEYQKGLDRLAALIRDTRDIAPDWRIIGKSVVRHSAQTPLDALEIEVEPPLYDSAALREVFEWADLLIHPSRYEGLPLVITDAMSNGVPVIATDVGAISEIVEHGHTGILLAEEGFEQAAAAQIRALARDRQQIKQMSLRALHRARDLQWSRSVDALDALIRDSRATRRRRT